MRKLICILFSILLLGNVYSADVFEEGSGADVISGSDSPSAIDTLLDAALTEPLGRLLQEYRQGAKIAYSSSTTITVAAGQVGIQNSTGTIVAFLDNTSSTNVTFANIDTGAESGSQTYYVYAYCATPSSDTDFDLCVSLSSSAPSGKTYYAKLGQFYNNSSNNIDETSIVNDNETAYPSMVDPFIYDSGWFAVSTNTTYSKTHSLGTIKVISLAYISDTSDGSGRVMTPPVDMFGEAAASIWVGSSIVDISTTTISLRTGINTLCRTYDAAGVNWSPTSGYARILMLALE